MSEYIVRTDAGCRTMSDKFERRWISQKREIASIGVSIVNEQGDEIVALTERVRADSANEAEVHAAVRGLMLVPSGTVELWTDSRYVHCQATRGLRRLKLTSMETALRCLVVYLGATVRLVTRDENWRADMLADLGMENREGYFHRKRGRRLDVDLSKPLVGVGRCATADEFFGTVNPAWAMGAAIRAATTCEARLALVAERERLGRLWKQQRGAAGGTG